MGHTISGRTMEHLAVLGIVEQGLASLQKSVAKMPDGGDKDRIVAVASRLAQQVAHCSVLTDPVDISLWSRKSLRRLVNTTERLQKCLDSFWPSGGTVACEYLAAALALVAYVDEQLPRTHKYISHRLEWGKLHKIMHEIYVMYDPDLEFVADIERGDFIADAIRKEVRPCS